jgi:hypothetical protein
MTRVVQIALLESPMMLEVLEVILVKTVQQDSLMILQVLCVKSAKRDSTSLTMVKSVARMTAVLGHTFLQIKRNVFRAV